MIFIENPSMSQVCLDWPERSDCIKSPVTTQDCCIDTLQAYATNTGNITVRPCSIV